MYKIMKKLVKIVCCNIIYRVKYIGIEKIDNNKKYVICPNHSNILDPTFIFPIVDNLSIMAKSEIFKNKLVAKILKRYRVFPVNRKERDVKSTLHAIECLNLENNSKLLIFPQVAKIKDSKYITKKVKNGAVYISAESGVEILPIFITRRPHIFQKVYVIIGNSINIPKEIKHDKEKIKEYSTKVINNIYDLEKIK